MSIQHAKSFFRPVDPIEAIRLIHRQMDGVITFHRTRQGEFKNLFGLKADETQQLLPPKMDELRTDAYFSLNAFWYNQQFGYVPAYRARRTERLRYLCTCFCDLDCYNANLTPNQAFTRVLAMEQSNAIPPISALVNEGVPSVVEGRQRG